jgi:hypothetical protein
MTRYKYSYFGMKILKITWLLLLLVPMPFLQASDDKDSTGAENILCLGIRGHYGFIIPHSKQIKELSYANPWGVEGEIAWHLMGEHIWRYCYCYPRTGFGLFYINFDNPEILGYSLALYPFIEPFVRAEKPLSFSFRFGIGPACVSKYYHPETNPDNFFFSSHLSFIVQLGFAFHYRINEHYTSRLGFNYNHISNGGIKEPNVGMNYPTLNIGLAYGLREAEFTGRSRQSGKDLYDRSCWFDAYLLGTAKNAEKGEDHLYPVIGAGIYYNYLFGRIIAASGGTEWVSDFSIKEKIRRLYAGDPEAELPDHNRAAALLGVDILFGRFSFLYQWGIYYYEPFPARNRAYQRYGLNFRFSGKLYAGVNLKAHGHVADLMDLRLGFIF